MPKVKRKPMPRVKGHVFLREWLTHKRITAEQLASALETSKSVISKLETGEQRWNQDWLEEVAFVFGCAVPDLYGQPNQAELRAKSEADKLFDAIPSELHEAARSVLAGMAKIKPH